MSFKNWKECTWKELNDGKDNGLMKVSVFFKSISYPKRQGKNCSKQFF